MINESTEKPTVNKSLYFVAKDTKLIVSPK